MFEQPFSKSEGNGGNDEMFLSNLMQIKLTERFYGFISNEAMMKWIEMYAKPFRELVTREPQLIGKFRKNQEEALAEVEEKLYAHKEQKQ